MLLVLDETTLRQATVSVETRTAAFSFIAQPGETLLAAGLGAGFDLPYECATGTCGTCHARVMDGHVDPGWTEAPAYRNLHRDKGDVLMCQARPNGDCAIRVKSRAAQPPAPERRDLQRHGHVEQVRRLAHDVMEFDLALSSPIRFDAGQFVTIGHPKLVGCRAYSMVNFDAESRRLTFVVKRKPEGIFSNLLFDSDLRGAELTVFGPLGRATFRPVEASDLICVAGGSGIAGMMSILQHATALNHFERHRGHVYFGVRTLADAFYVEQLAAHVVQGNGRLDVTIAVSHEADPPPLHGTYPGIAIAAGMVHEVVERTAPATSPATIAFVAGPQPMVDAALRVLITRTGIAPDRVRFDKFG